MLNVSCDSIVIHSLFGFSLRDSFKLHLNLDIYFIFFEI